MSPDFLAFIASTNIKVFGVFFIIAISVFFYCVTIYNGLVALKRNAEKAWSNIDILLKQRYDELPKLVSVCERYMKHEAETLEKVIKARNMASASSSKDMKGLGEAEGMLTGALKSLFAVTENYPELKADKQFGQLQSRVSELEDEIADRRELFNSSINIYNIRIEQFPDVFIAGMFNYKEKELWKIQSAHRVDPGISFSS